MSDPKNVVSQIRKATRRKFTAEEKIRIVLEALRGEIPIVMLQTKLDKSIKNVNLLWTLLKWICYDKGTQKICSI